MTFKLLKRRYRSSDNDDKLRELEYFNHPYAKGSSIRLIDDIEMDESISLTSLASEFVAADTNNNKRGKKNAVERAATPATAEGWTAVGTSLGRRQCRHCYPIPRLRRENGNQGRSLRGSAANEHD